MTPLASMSPTLRDDDFGSIAGPLRIAGFLGRFRPGAGAGGLRVPSSRMGHRPGPVARGNAVTAHRHPSTHTRNGMFRKWEGTEDRDHPVRRSPRDRSRHSARLGGTSQIRESVRGAWTGRPRRAHAPRHSRSALGPRRREPSLPSEASQPATPGDIVCRPGRSTGAFSSSPRGLFGSTGSFARTG